MRLYFPQIIISSKHPVVIGCEVGNIKKTSTRQQKGLTRDCTPNQAVKLLISFIFGLCLVQPTTVFLLAMRS
jgi:hypothetical protein